MSFLTEALVFLLAAIIVVPICKRLGLSSVLGYLAAGLLIGPSGLRVVGDASGVMHFAEIGVVLLLFIIGLELQPRRLWVMRRAVFGLGSAQVLVTSAAISTLLVLVFNLAWPAALLVGFALALSSTAFVLQLLGERRELNHTHGRAAFGVLLLQDVAVIPAIAMLSLLAPPVDGGANAGLDPWLLLAALAGLIVARFSLRPLLRFVAATGIHELFVAAGLAIVVGAALAMQAVGLSMGLGAFIAGMIVADSEYRHQLETDIMPFKGLLLGLFFMAVGMSANLVLLLEMPWLILGLALGLVLIKGVLLIPLAALQGMGIRDALRTAVLLSQGGEFAFVLLTAGASAALISDAMVEIVVLVVTLSMVSTPFLVSLLERLLRSDEDVRPFDKIDAVQNPVVIAGFGRFGQIVGRVLTMRHIPFTALEVSPSQVDFVRRFGNEIYYGDATRLDLLQSAQVARASALVLAIDDVAASLLVAERVRETCPDVKIFARARDRRHELMLRELGVHHVIRETLMSGLELTRALLGQLGNSAEQADQYIEAFYAHDRRTLAKQAAVLEDDEAFRQAARDASEELKLLFDEDSAAEADNLKADPF